MKWPKSVTLIRHGQSRYNELKKKKMVDPLYQEFINSYETGFETPRTKELAIQIWQKYSLKSSDAETRLTSRGEWQAYETGLRLKDVIELPDVIFVSPYTRTCQTLDELKRAWQKLAGVKTYEDERIREQDHGLSVLYSDWRVFQVMHLEQKIFREMMGPYWYKYPQGENIPDVRLRNRLFTTTLIREYADKNVLVVTHHLNILSIRANYERLTAEQFIELDEKEKPINCGVTIYKGNPQLGENGKLVLEKYNERLYPKKNLPRQ